MILKLWFALYLIFATCASYAAEPEKALAPATLEQTQELVHQLEQELAIHKQTLQQSLDANDKRLADLGALTTMQGSHTTSWVGNLVILVSIGIAVLVSAAGFLTYFSAATRARDEARHVVKEWFDEEAQGLKAQNQKMQHEADDLMARFQSRTPEFQTTAKKAAGDIMQQASNATAKQDAHGQTVNSKTSYLFY